MDNSSPHLLRSRRFVPYFFTQFLGAFNDNVYKQSLVYILTYQLLAFAVGVNIDLFNNLAAGVFILPFVLFSAIAGQVADKYEKGRLIRVIKMGEVLIMSLAALGFYLGSLPILMLALVLTGTQSAFFGPIKYSILPQHLQKTELTSGNGLVEMGTFIAIILGTLVAGLLIKSSGNIALWVSVSIVVFAVFGLISAQFIPSAPAADAGLTVDFNIWRQSGKIIRLARKNNAVFLATLGVSWFWFMGASFMTQLPRIVSTYLSGNEDVLNVFLAAFSIGIGSGSILTARLSGKRAELGLIAVGALGMLIVLLDVIYNIHNAVQTTVPELLSLAPFFQQAGSYRLLGDFVVLGLFGGLYVVPLTTYIQEKAERQHLSRIIAANNIFNALAMVCAAVLAIVCLSALGWNIPQLFILVAGLHVVASIIIFTRTKIFFARFVIWVLSHTIYRITHVDTDNYIPDDGAAVLVANHVSFVDAILIASSTQRLTRFVMYKPIYESPALGWLFKSIGAIPICGKAECEATYLASFDKIAEYLENGELVCIFPEGAITKDGDIAPFKKGIEKIISRTPVPVVPMALQGLWGGFFSHKDKQAFKRPFRRLWSKVTILAGESIPAEAVTADYLQQRVQALRQDKR